ncbi:MFS transporter [Mobiluncus mulieris]|uniref:MFS transporter n=1 Tax=Mobiluncus mulieris TaxID=2052 RepID=UPI0021E33484|nr:MFS transporter [Mobiluncus mulieris]MCU9996872.1 MFS transporter [Mobiluncus mulieris]
MTDATKSSKWPVFLRRHTIAGFLAVVMAGQLVYSSFEAFKGSLIIPMTNALGLTNEQYGTLWSWIGIAMFLYVPAGWINNRFTIRNILLVWSVWRLVTFLLLWLAPIGYTGMVIIAASWGVWDAIGWPAVVNGVSYMSKDSDTEGRGMAMGLLETIRRAAEFLMNVIVVALITIFPKAVNEIMVGFGVGYALLLIPLVLCLLKFVPKNAIAHEEKTSDNMAALKGLLKVLAIPRVWLAGVAALCLYWGYINMFWSSAPYLIKVYHISDGVSAIFGIFNTAAVGILAGLVSGFLADYVFKSSTVMMAVALGTVMVASIVVFFLPNNPGAMWPAILLLIVTSFGVFLGKAVILAPIAELHLPEQINGGAMAVGSFLAYAAVFWANKMNGKFLDDFKGQEYWAYHWVFLITAGVTAIGMVCAILLAIINKRRAVTHQNAGTTEAK